MTDPGLRGSTVLNYDSLIQDYTPTLAGTWFGPGQTANKGQAYAFMGFDAPGAGYVMMAVATVDGITAYPDSSGGSGGFGVDGNGWLVIGPYSNTPVQLRQNANSDTGHIDNYDINIANITAGYDGAWGGGSDFHLTFNSGGVDVHLTEGMDITGVQTAIRAAFSDDRIRCYTDDFTRSFNVVGPADLIFTSNPGITGDTTGQNVTLANLFHYKGWPAPFASTFHLMGAALSEGHLFLRDSNTPTNPDNPTDYLRGWDELAVTKFQLIGDFSDTFGVRQNASDVTTTINQLFARFSRQGLAYGELRLDGHVTLGADGPGGGGAITIDLGDILNAFLPFSYFVAVGGMTLGCWSPDGTSLANITQNTPAWILYENNTTIQLVDQSFASLTTAVANGQAFQFSLNCLISND